MRWYSGSSEFCNTNLSLTALLAEAMHESSKQLTAILPLRSELLRCWPFRTVLYSKPHLGAC